MAISTLLLDLETKSDVDLTKSGVYRYADSPYFDGHFPEFALLPGVVQVKWAQDVACRYWHLAGSVVGIKALKFMFPIRPDDTVVLRLSRSAGKVNFLYESPEGKTLSRGTLLLEDGS